ncbi:hypothetical protein [Bradyrhizobium sp. UFLA05-112]
MTETPYLKEAAAFDVPAQILDGTKSWTGAESWIGAKVSLDLLDKDPAAPVPSFFVRSLTAALKV